MMENNYSNLTDFEINKAVDGALGISSVVDVSDGMSCYTYTDYTGSMTRCIELMLRYQISLMRLDGTNVWIAFTHGRFDTVCMSPDGSDNGVSIFDSKHTVHNTKPLRAVCESFLMMRESGLAP